MAAGDKIPEEYRSKLTDVFNYIVVRSPSVPLVHIKYLFEAYNKFIEPHNPKDVTCKTEVARVLKVFRIYTTIWKRQEENLQK
jgi:hypothetical protein